MVDHKVENLACLRVVISNHTTDGLVSFIAKGTVVSLDLYWSAVIVYDQGVTSKYTCVSV